MAYADVILGTPGLVSYWRLGETADPVVDAAGANDGSVAQGTPTRGVTGLLVGDTDTAYDFVPTSRVDVPDDATLDFTSQITLEAWIKPDSVTGEQLVAGKDLIWYLLLNGTSLQGGVQIGGDNHTVVATSQIGIAETAYLALTYDGATLRMYKNAVEIGTPSVVADVITTNTWPLSMGRRAQFNEMAFDGVIDEVAVYSIGLDAGTLSTHYSAGLDIFPPTLRTVQSNLRLS